MNRVLGGSVRAKLALDIFVPEDPHRTWQVLSVRAEDASKEGDWRKEGERRGLEAGGRAGGCGIGEETWGEPHDLG